MFTIPKWVENCCFTHNTDFSLWRLPSRQAEHPSTTSKDRVSIYVSASKIAATCPSEAQVTQSSPGDLL